MQREDWDRRYSSVENLWAVKPNRFLVAEVAELPPGRALDLACGEGQNAIWLATLGWDVIGVDFSEVGDREGSRASRARRRAGRVRVRRPPRVRARPRAPSISSCSSTSTSRRPSDDRCSRWRSAALAAGGHVRARRP